MMIQIKKNNAIRKTTLPPILIMVKKAASLKNLMKIIH